MNSRHIILGRSCLTRFSLSHSISHLLIFTCLLLSLLVNETAQVAPVASKLTTGTSPASATDPRPTAAVKPAQNAANLGPFAKSIAPFLQAAMAVAPKVAAPAPPPSLPSSSFQARPVIKKSSSAIVQQASGGGGGQARMRGQINQEEPIIQLDYSSISDEILNKRTANFVYFNANFNTCRHCQRFFTIWKDLALDIRWWRNVIKMFTINCSDEDNIDVCRRAGVTQFPQLKFYWIMSNNLDQDGQRLRILGKSVHAMRHLIMDKVLESYLEHNKLLAQRDRQRATPSANPLSALTSLTAPNGPLSAFLPMLSQLMGATGPASNSNSSGATSSSGGGLASLMGMLTGKPVAGAGGSPGGGGLSLTSLMSSIGGMQGISQLINALMSMASWRRSLTLQPLPSNWPKLKAIDASNSQQLLNKLPIGPGRASTALLIMETQEFLYTGLEVMLDLNPYTLNQTYYIARVRDERSQLSKNLTKLDDVQAPALIYVNEAREPKLIVTAPKYTNDEDLRRAFVKAFEKRQIKYPLKRVWPASGSLGANLASGSRGTNSTEADEEIMSRLNDVYMNDLLNTVRSSLIDQVLRHPDLTDDQYNALVKYVYVLINYFPFNNDEQLKFFKRLHTWLQNQVSPVDVSEYKKQFHDVDDVLGKKRDWVSCKSLSSVNSVPSRKKSGSLFENPSQFGKVVSNLTRLFRANQQKVGQLKNLVGIFASSLNSPVVLTNTNQQVPGGPQQTRRLGGTSSTSTTSSPISPTLPPSSRPPASSSSSSKTSEKKEESSLEKLIKSLTSGSLGSDSSMLKLISTALGGGGAGDSKPGKSKFAREYSCGAWKLAHVMVVNEYIRDSPRKDVKHIVLHSLYQYMLHFYACTTCGNRVSDVSGEFRMNLNENLLLDQGDSIMLLWKMHNRVNKRLESEIRPGSPPKQQFPSESLCPKCRAAKKPTDSLSTPNWHEKQVLNFLVHHYRPQNINTNVDSSSSSDTSSSILPASPNLSLILSFFIITTFWQAASRAGCLTITSLGN